MRPVLQVLFPLRQRRARPVSRYARAALASKRTPSRRWRQRTIPKRLSTRGSGSKTPGKEALERSASADSMRNFRNFIEIAARSHPVPANDPKAVPFRRVVSFLPLCRNHRTVPNFHDQIANGQSRRFGHPHEIAMRPLGLVIIHHICDLREQ